MGKKNAYYTRSPRSALEYLMPLVFSVKTIHELPPKERKQFKEKRR